LNQNLGFGDWGLGIGDWGLGIGPQSPIPILDSKNIFKKIKTLINYI